MRQITSLQEAIIESERRWGVQFKEKNASEAAAPCPFCSLSDDDAFLVWERGNYWCRKCGAKGWILEEEKDKLSEIERRLLIQEAKTKALERELERQKQETDAIKKMLECQAHLVYHRQVDTARDYWHSQGINDESISRFTLGFCQHTPLWQSRPSYTIPIVNNGKLRNIRYRLQGDEPPRYLPHIKNLPITLFNADRIIKPTTEYIIIAEGEKKGIVLEQNGFPAVCVCGTNAFDDKWLPWFRFGKVFVAFDPDAIEKGAALAKKFGNRGRVVELPDKPDDMFVSGCTSFQFAQYLRKARVA